MYYPVFLDIKDKLCVVVGGGQVALRKVKNLLECGAKVRVISPEICLEIENLSRNSSLDLIRRMYRAGDLDGATVAFSATGDPETNHQISQDARKQSIPVNVVDDAAISDFIVPSYFSRGDIIVAVSTSGKSPALARKIRTELEKCIGDEFNDLVVIVNEVRTKLIGDGVRIDGEKWQEALDIDMLLNLVREGRKDEARKLLLDGLLSGAVSNGEPR